MNIDRIDVQSLLKQIDIVGYIGQYLDLEFNGKEYLAISPFSKKDINPSFTITPENQLWYDYSAGYGGNGHITPP